MKKNKNQLSLNFSGYVIMSNEKFMTGTGGWSKEYPDAKIFNTEQSAVDALKKKREMVTSFKYPWTKGLGTATVIENYGLDNERDCGYQIIDR